MSLGHDILSSVEKIVVLGLGGSLASVIVTHGGVDEITDTGLKGSIEDVQVQEVINCAGLVLGCESRLHLAQVGEREVKLLALACLLYLLNEVPGGLAHHDGVLTFVGWNGRDSREQAGESGVRLVASTATGASGFLNIVQGLVGEGRFETGEDVMEPVHS